LGPCGAGPDFTTQCLELIRIEPPNWPGAKTADDPETLELITSTFTTRGT